MKKEIELSVLQKRLKQLKYIDSVSMVPLRELAKECAIKPTMLMDIIELNPKLFNLYYKTLKEKKTLYVKDIFLKSDENIDTEEGIAKKIKKYEKHLELSYYNNYTIIEGYYIAPSEAKGGDKKDLWLNSLSKVEQIRDKLSLKKAGYHLGGFGDSSYLQPENGYEIKSEQLRQLQAEGWTIVGEFEDGK